MLHILILNFHIFPVHVAPHFAAVFWGIEYDIASLVVSLAPTLLSTIYGVQYTSRKVIFLKYSLPLGNPLGLGPLTLFTLYNNINKVIRPEITLSQVYLEGGGV